MEQDVLKLNKEGEYVCNAEYIHISLNKEILDKKSLSKINESDFNCFGFFIIEVYKEDLEVNPNAKIIKKYRVAFPSLITLTPLSFKETKEGSVLVFKKGDIVISSNLLLQDVMNPYTFFKTLIMGSYLPKGINYDEIIHIWLKCNELNSLDLKLPYFILETIISALTKSPNDSHLDYRKYLNKLIKQGKKIDLEDFKLVRAVELAQLSSTFAALTSAGASNVGKTRSILRSKIPGSENKESPIEKGLN